MRHSWILFFMFACNEQKLHSIEEENAGDGPKIEVSPQTLNFGTVSSNDDPVVQTFTVSSVGDTDIVVDGLELTGDAIGSFAFVEVMDSMVLPPGTSQDVDVIFDPIGSSSQMATAIVSSNDEEDPHVLVNLIGDGAVSELQITPNPLDFGETYVGCDKGNEITLTNVGTEALEVLAIDHTGSPFTLVEDLSLPITLEPEESATVHMIFTPDEPVSASGELSVISTEPQELRVATQTGTGAYVATFEQLWTNPAEPPADIIFSVDLSCSMDDDTENLANNFGTFINELSNYSNDWQVMVVNDDDGCTNSGILRPTTNNYVGLFQNAVQTCSNCGFFGEPMYTESLLTITSLAVENTDVSECNAGFLRPNAMLHVIMVSDEPEQSLGSWDSYVNQIIAKKGNASNVRMSAIAGDYPSGCSSADAGTGYYESVQMTGGVFKSICGNWSDPASLADLAEASIVSDSYLLDHEPIESTIQVFVNGTEVTVNWTFDPTINSVIFEEGYAPEEGDSIRIVYSVPADCD